MTTRPMSASRWPTKRRMAWPGGGGAVGSVTTAKSDMRDLGARVNHRDHDVGDQVSEHDHEGAYHQDGHEDRIVARAERIDEQEAHAGPAKHRLRYEGASDEQRKLQPAEGNQWRQRGAKGVVDEDAAWPNALGARCADEILIEDFEHVGAGIAAPLRHEHKRQNGDGKDQMAQDVEEAAAV